MNLRTKITSVRRKKTARSGKYATYSVGVYKSYKCVHYTKGDYFTIVFRK